MADAREGLRSNRPKGAGQARILEAEGEAQSIKLVNEAADKYTSGTLNY
jgi:regulator of protease activity HflC (stomatin/prohibitin superfamily)